jgi:hypothetical protein
LGGIGEMAVYAVCLGMTLAVAAESEEEAIEKARVELQGELDNGHPDKQRVAWNFDMYDVSEVMIRGEILNL